MSRTSTPVNIVILGAFAAALAAAILALTGHADVIAQSALRAAFQLIPWG